MGGSSLSPLAVPRYDELVLLVMVRRGERGRVGSSLSSSGVGKSLLRPNLLDSELKADGLDGLRSGDSDALSGIILLSRFFRPSNVPNLFNPLPDFFSGSEARSAGAATASVRLRKPFDAVKLTASRAHACAIIVVRARTQRRRNENGLAVPGSCLFWYHVSARDT